MLIKSWGTQDVSLCTAAFCFVSEDTKATEVWWREASLWVAIFGSLFREGALQDHRAARAWGWSGSKTAWWELRWLLVWQEAACPAKGSELFLAGRGKPVQVLEQRSLNVHLTITTIPVGSATKYTCILKHELHPPQFHQIPPLTWSIWFLYKKTKQPRAFLLLQERVVTWNLGWVLPFPTTPTLGYLSSKKATCPAKAQVHLSNKRTNSLVQLKNKFRLLVWQG